MMTILEALLAKRGPDPTIGMSRRQRRAYNMAKRKEQKLERWKMRKAVWDALLSVPVEEEIAEWNRLRDAPKIEVPWRIVSARY